MIPLTAVIRQADTISAYRSLETACGTSTECALSVHLGPAQRSTDTNFTG
jgi:hypothetical protein